MIDDVMGLWFVDFSSLTILRFHYVEQTKISKERVDLATACATHNGLHMGKVICYIRGEYTGENRDADTIFAVVSPCIEKEDCDHIRQIINQGCPSYLKFEETFENKYQVLCMGN
jgi:hypothetical protein